MTSNYHKKIKEFIKSEKFAHLSFLDNEWFTSKDKAYIGFYYFILCLKNEKNEHVLDEIISREGSLSNAYLYLGKTATDIYDTQRSNHISLNFFRKAIEADSHNSDAYWCIYLNTYDFKYLIKSVKINRKNNNLNQAIKKISYAFNSNNIDKISKEDLLFLKEIYTSPDSTECKNKNDILALIYFLLDEFDLGIEIIRNSNHLNYDIINKYFDKNLIDFNLALSKVYFFNKEKFLLGDNKKIYEIYKEEAKKGQPNPTKDALIHKAYLADQFLDVINYFKEGKEKNDFIDKLKSSLYYLLAQTELKQDIDSNRSLS